MTTYMLKCFMFKHYLNYLFIVTKPDIVISRLLCAASKELHRTSYYTMYDAGNYKICKLIGKRRLLRILIIDQ